jgi:uncharacterized protein
MQLFWSEDEAAPARKVTPPPTPQMMTAIHPMRVTLLVSEGCNLRCEYCYVAHHGRINQMPAMDAKTVCRAVDLCGGNPTGYSFFGGEPLLGWDAIEWAVERAIARAAVSRTQKPTFHVTSNLVLMTPEKAAFLVKHGFSVLASIDGPEEIHDHYRKDASGNGSFQRTMDGIAMLRDAGMPAGSITLRATFVPDLLRIAERLECLNTLCDDGYGAGVALEPAVGCNGSTCKASSDGYTKELLAGVFREGADWMLGRIKREQSARWHYMDVGLRRLYNRQPAFSECGAGRGYCAVRPNGEIHTCHKCVYPIGQLPTGIEESRCKPWLDNRLTSNPTCNQCWARFICGGGCRAEGIEDCEKIQPGTVGCMVSHEQATQVIRILGEMRENKKFLDSLKTVPPKPPQEQKPPQQGR